MLASSAAPCTVYTWGANVRPRRRHRALGVRCGSLRTTAERPAALNLSRRSSLGLMAGVAGFFVSMSSTAEAEAAGMSDPGMLTRRGMAKFVQNDVEGSVEDFDLVMLADPARTPYLWQRGLSLYYAERFEDGAKQFRRDVAVNPNDTEEAIWAFLCEAQTVGIDKAREQILRVDRDPRSVMRNAYALFKGSGSVDQLREAGNTSASDLFYSRLYIGLWHEANGDAERAKQEILDAVDTPYAKRSGDYMAGLALVHAKRRGWLA